MKKTAVDLTAAAVLLCMVILFALCITAPFLIGIYAEIRSLEKPSVSAILWGFYLSVLPVSVSLGCMLRLLCNIRRDQPFLRQNSSMMSAVSWCCVAVSLICLISGVWYMPLLFISAAMVFLFLIVRVVRGCFIAATALKEENSLTI